MDMTALMSQVMQSKIAGIMYQGMQSSQPRRYAPDSTRRAFDAQMQADTGVFRQSSQNMKDAMAMVTVAQSGVTTIKHHLTEMHKIATEMATLDGMSDEQYASYSKILEEHSGFVTSLAENIEFNGMQLLNGSAGMNDDGVVVLQGGGHSMNQVFTNLLDAESAGVLGDSGTMNLNALAGETNIANKAEAQALVEKLGSYIDRVAGIEADYTFDIRSLENLSVLYENQADIFESTIQYKEKDDEAEEPTPLSYLEQFLAKSSTGSIFSGLS